ncbi:hypothetical protein BLUESHADOW_73 [Citrobacter phage vB_CfrD_BlueShadow]|uniref:Uncharacterized protein n=1 Tax=Citrobacter phage vB_CfrD_BlueShadow TaxID=2902660 RepID=A0AC61TQ38_9CAUD|nr:hypothetical protein BLUESHADOW_73 [Citrobacter phage vB_CfrD_BlueShadow]
MALSFWQNLRSWRNKMFWIHSPQGLLYVPGVELEERRDGDTVNIITKDSKGHTLKTYVFNTPVKVEKDD